MSLAKGFAFFFKQAALSFIDVFYCFPVSASFINIYALIFIINFLLFILGVVCFSFSNSLSCKSG